MVKNLTPDEFATQVMRFSQMLANAGVEGKSVKEYMRSQIGDDNSDIASSYLWSLMGFPDVEEDKL